MIAKVGPRRSNIKLLLGDNSQKRSQRIFPGEGYVMIKVITKPTQEIAGLESHEL